MSTRFRAFEARIQWREIVTVKGKIIGALPARDITRLSLICMCWCCATQFYFCRL
jgi:hypothetical protein